ncbi:MAG: fluoride efflux transporter CrcB [Magnetococcales bacterium]|nr:fluoride efflux transporter CrcB [Magnetococcales bacterium]
MKTLLFVAAGGSLGAVLRFLISNWTYQWLGRGFPWGTLAVNVLGSFLMGLLFVVFTDRMVINPDLKLGILVGGLGALTTFSTFSIDTLNLMERGAHGAALVNSVVSVVACIFAVWLGLLVAKLI